MLIWMCRFPEWISLTMITVVKKTLRPVCLKRTKQTPSSRFCQSSEWDIISPRSNNTKWPQKQLQTDPLVIGMIDAHLENLAQAVLYNSVQLRKKKKKSMNHDIIISYIMDRVSGADLVFRTTWVWTDTMPATSCQGRRSRSRALVFYPPISTS